MSFTRRLAGLVLVASTFAVLGCGGNAPPPGPDGPDQPVTETPTQDGLVGPVRWEEKEPEPPPPPKPGEIVLPQNGGQWPWQLAAAPAPVPFRPVTIPNVTDWVTGMAVRPALGRAVVTIKIGWKKIGESNKTRVVWCDTAAGKVLADWEVKGAWVPCDLSPDGNRILARKVEGTQLGDRLTVWTIGDDRSLRQKSWVPHSLPGVGVDGALVTSAEEFTNAADPSRDVVWAAWVGPNRIVSSSHAGQFRAFDADTFEQVGSIDATPGRPAVTPDGTRVAFLVSNGVVLFDPETGQVTGARRTGTPPAPAALAFSPDGKRLAIGGSDRTTFLDLVAGHSWDTIYPKSPHGPKLIPESFGWADGTHLFADHFLYDLNTPIPVWDYGGVGQARCLGRQTWVVVKGFDKVATLRPFVFPHPGVEGRVAAEAAKPGVFTLRPGDAVRVDVSGIPAENRAEVSADLQKRLRAIGYRPDPSGVVAAVASEDPTGTPASARYIGQKPIAYTRRPTRLKLVKDGKVLWEQAWAHEPPFSVALDRTQSLSEHLHRGGVGSPNYDLFSTAPIPSMFRGPKAPIFAFGSSDLQPDGIKDRR